MRKLDTWKFSFDCRWCSNSAVWVWITWTPHHSLPDFSHLSRIQQWFMLIWDIWNTIKCVFILLHVWIDCYLIEAARHVKNADPVRRALWKFYWFIALVVCSLKRGVGILSKVSLNRLTRHSRSGKHGRLGHAIGTREMSRSLAEKYTFYLFF